MPNAPYVHCRTVVGLAVLLAAMVVAIAAAAPAAAAAAGEKPILRTPKPGPAPRINGPEVYGCRPGRPLIYRIPTTGTRPIAFRAAGLPASLRLDSATGIITGTAPSRGTHTVVLHARNAAGQASRSLKIVAGDTLALTPPMGWNHWYAYYDRVTDNRVREAADAMVRSGMADVGYQYVNIDDCWANAPKHADPLRVGPLRDPQGNILPNRHFPDMRSLTDAIHAKGLKAGIYTSPGPLTCAGFAGSYGHEAQDARQFAGWGFDFLKYDWCSYGKVVHGDKRLATLQKPYRRMGGILRELDRDIVLNLCQYGMGNVWEWGAEVGGQSWRTAGDLGFELNRIFAVALSNAAHRDNSGPGSWNDPDYIQIGYIGSARGMGKPRPCPLTPDEQYAFMSLWSLMAAPLFYSGDMSRLDALTLNVLCNPEVIAVDQDPLGQSAHLITRPDASFVMVKDMADGSKAVGLFNHGQHPVSVTATWAELKIEGPQRVRDLWRQRDLGVVRDAYQADVARRAGVLIRLWPADP